MSGAREEILCRVRRGMPSVGIEPGAPGIPRPAQAGDLALRFAAETAKAGTECHVEKSRQDALARMALLLAGQGVFAWSAPHLPGDASRLAAQVALRYDEAGGAFARRAAWGLTGCDLGIAAFGALLLNAGPGKPREASLVVRQHLVLLDPGRLVMSLEDALDALGPDPAHVNIISGPSRTADIEMTLTQGVHGPKRLVVILAPWH